MERDIAHWVHHERSIRRPIALRASGLPRSYISLYKEATDESLTTPQYKLKYWCHTMHAKSSVTRDFGIFHYEVILYGHCII